MNTNSETQSEETFDTKAALAEISDGLFGQAEGDGEKSLPAEGEKPATPETQAVETQVSPQTEEPTKTEAPIETQTSPEVQALGAPSSWTKEALAEWAAVPDGVKKEIHRREGNFHQYYQETRPLVETATQFNSVIEPYQPLLSAANINPLELVKNFAANHYILARGTPEQKVQLAATMLQGYGIDFNALVDFVASADTSPPDPKLVALEREVQELRSLHQRQAEAQKAQSSQQIDAEIEAFAADPKNIYFNEVVSNMHDLFAAGSVKTLQEAYDQAVWLNPITRQKELDRIAAERTQAAAADRTTRQNRVSKVTSADIRVEPKSRDGTVLLGSMEDTLQSTLDSIRSRG